ncbi:hypothetical protein SNE40_020063 [Patella caerulea]|uniref:Uncharacterized protein n=2 Tax=Patella caerulea TaxID=87958 RepID=A0AAN8J130_PATCE
MPASPGCEEVTQVICEKHPLYRHESDESGQSGRSGDSNKSSGNSQMSRDAGLSSRLQKKDGNNMQHKGAGGTRIDFGEYYPDGGWGWVVVIAATLVHILCNGFHFSYGSLYLEIRHTYKTDEIDTAWLGSLGIGISLFISPFVTIICRRKSPRLYAVIGGLICALGCLFLAFSTQPEQLFISHCVVMSLGSGITLSTANIMVGRYFRRRRELAEMILVSGTGIGTAVMSVLFRKLIGAIKWMYALQSVAGLLVLTIIAGALYRSASLYHPRRKVILHLKNQKKNRRDREAEKPPYLDFSALKMRSLQALLAICGIVAIGIHVPFITLMRTASENKNIDGDHLLLLNVYLGVGFVIGCCALGYIIIKNSNDCSISRRHLCQTSAILCGVFTLLFIMAQDHNAHSLYAWAYGICCGSYYLTLKMYAYELVRHKLMERAWSFVCAVQCFPFLFGAPVATYLKDAHLNDVGGYIFAGVAMIVGGLLFYTMPYFERHPSNQEILQKQNSSCSAHMSEAAALLDLELSEALTSKPLNNLQCIMSHSKLKPNCKDGNKIQLQCYIQHKEREKPKQLVLSKIAEERDGTRINEITHNNKMADCVTNKNEFSESATDGPSDSTFSNNTDKSSSKDSNSVKTNDSKKSKKNDVRIDLFDPPSQEKESTATVSYDSDLYINLCEAQV